MGWVVRELVKALLPTVVLPALVAGLMIYRFGFTLESLVAILVFTQLYVAWAWVEAALRQAYLAMLEYGLEFNIENLGCWGDFRLFHHWNRNMVRHVVKASTRIYLLVVRIRILCRISWLVCLCVFRLLLVAVGRGLQRV